MGKESSLESIAIRFSGKVVLLHSSLCTYSHRGTMVNIELDGRCYNLLLVMGAASTCHFMKTLQYFERFRFYT